jgi:predicted nucleic acid-binding protein
VPSPLLLDACVIVNLHASRQMAAILAATETPCAVVDAVHREAQYLYRGGAGDDAREREQIDLSPLVASGLLTVIDVRDEDELLTYIDLTREIDDGEAMTPAVAIHRRLPVATDDRKALRILERHSLDSSSTLGLIRAWSDQASIGPETLRAALIDLRQRGNYLPARNHPLKAWWDSIMDQ